MRYKLANTAVALTASMVLVGCGGSGGEADTSVEVRGTQDLNFEPSEFAAPAGEEVTVELATDETVEHDFTIEGATDVGQASGGTDGEHEDGDTPETDLLVVHVAPGETGTGTFTINESGTYTVYCSVPGHREAGMEATLEIVPPGE